MMRTVIFGGNGQLGSEWSDFMEKKGMDYVSYTSTEADITSTKRVREILEATGPDTVINCAAYTDVDRAETDRERALEVNAHAVGNMAELCRDRGIRLVHYSTDYVFPGREKDRQRNPGGYREHDSVSPVNWYGATKLKGERALRDSGATHLLGRTSWLCGRHGQNFITTMLKLGGERERVSIVNDQWGSPSFTENVVLNSFSLLQGDFEGTYHISSEGLVTWCELAEEVFDYAGLEVEVEPVTSDYFSREADRPRFSKLNLDKLRTVPGNDIWNWKQGVHRLLDELDARGASR